MIDRTVLKTLFQRRDTLTLLILVAGTVLNGLLEVAGLGMMLPYVDLLQNPDRIHTSRYLKAVSQLTGLSDPRSFLIAISGLLLALFVAKGVAALWVANAQYKFVNFKLADLGVRMLGGYLDRPYSFFLGVNSSVLLGNLTTSITQLCQGVVQSLLGLAAEATVSIGIVALLIGVSPVFSIVSIVALGGLSLGYRRMIRARVARFARDNDVHWKSAIRYVNESLGAAKEVQLAGCQTYFLDAYHREMERFGWANRRNGVMNQLPRVTLESISVAGMVIFALTIILSGKPAADGFTTLAAFAVATVRVVPSATRMLQAWNTFSFYRPSIHIVVDALREAPRPELTPPKASAEAMRLRERLDVDVRSFAYADNPHFRMSGVRVGIRRGQTVAFIGPSGSGKTTLVDMLLGFYPAFEGSISVDGTDIRDNLPAWRGSIGYIPQTIYVRDDTILRNVAFGVPDEKIDVAAAERAIDWAGLRPVVSTQAQGIHTVVGDRGLRISGGERQRIGIARALYHDPEVLVLDEATSALDHETERLIVESILSLSPAKTVIAIAHRLSTVQHCDVVYLMHRCAIVDSGTFEEVAGRRRELQMGVA